MTHVTFLGAPFIEGVANAVLGVVMILGLGFWWWYPVMIGLHVYLCVRAQRSRRVKVSRRPRKDAFYTEATKDPAIQQADDTLRWMDAQGYRGRSDQGEPQ
jgi:hypothetical protein